MGKFVAKRTRDVNVSALDFFTLGHIVMGYITWIISFIIIWFTPYGDIQCLSMVSTIMVGIVWEYIENFLLRNKTSIKFEGRKDSLENSLTDIIAVVGGGSLAWFFSYFPLVVYALVSIDLILGLLVLMKRLSKMTKKR